MNAETSQQTLENPSLVISGGPRSRRDQIGRTVLSAGLFYLAYVWLRWSGLLWEDAGDYPGLWGTLAVASTIVALMLPSGTYEYIDFVQRAIVTERWFLFSHTREETPLSHFGRIVLRHLCHSGGEGEDTFNASIGLKPAQQGSVRWVKEFPATQDEMPAAADKFARELSATTGLPYLGYPPAN